MKETILLIIASIFVFSLITIIFWIIFDVWITEDSLFTALIILVSVTITNLAYADVIREKKENGQTE